MYDHPEIQTWLPYFARWTRMMSNCQLRFSKHRRKVIKNGRNSWHKFYSPPPLSADTLEEQAQQEDLEGELLEQLQELHRKLLQVNRLSSISKLSWLTATDQRIGIFQRCVARLFRPRKGPPSLQLVEAREKALSPKSALKSRACW